MLMLKVVRQRWYIAVDGLVIDGLAAVTGEPLRDHCWTASWDMGEDKDWNGATRVIRFSPVFMEWSRLKRLGKAAILEATGAIADPVFGWNCERLGAAEGGNG